MLNKDTFKALQPIYFLRRFRTLYISINVVNVLSVTFHSHSVPLLFTISFEDTGRAVGKGHLVLLKTLDRVLTFHNIQ